MMPIKAPNSPHSARKRQGWGGSLLLASNGRGGLGSFS